MVSLVLWARLARLGLLVLIRLFLALWGLLGLILWCLGLLARWVLRVLWATPGLRVLRGLPVRLALRGRKASRVPRVLLGLWVRKGIRVIRALMVRMAVLVLTGRKVKWDQSVLPDQQGKTGP